MFRVGLVDSVCIHYRQAFCFVFVHRIENIGSGRKNKGDIYEPKITPTSEQIYVQ